MIKRNKKGQVLSNLGALAIGIVTLTIVLIIAFLMADQVKDTTSETITSTTIMNESITYANATAFRVSYPCVRFSCLRLANDSISGTNVTITAANYTCIITGDQLAQITVTNNFETAGAFTNPLFLDYTCSVPNTGYNATATLVNATATVPGWVPLIVLVAIGGLILGLVGVFGRSG